MRVSSLRWLGALVVASGLAGCSEGEPPGWDVADAPGAFPVQAGPPAGAPTFPPPGFAAPPSGSLSGSASASASGTFTGTLPPGFAGGPGGFPVQTGYPVQSGYPASATAAPRTGAGYREPGAFRGEAEVGGVPLVSGTLDESGEGNSVYSVDGEVLELP